MGTREDNGDGSCCEVISGRHAGKWRVQFTLVDERGHKSRLSRLFAKKTDAKNELRDLRHGKVVQKKRNSQELTLATWVEWLAANDWPESLDEKTIATRRSRFARDVCPQLGEVPLISIESMAVRRFYQSLR